MIPLGLFLCRYKLKYVLISILGLIQTTVYLSQIIMLVVNYLKTTNHNIIGLLLEYGIPVGFFLIAAVGIVRSGLQIWADHWQYQQKQAITVHIPLRTRLRQWRLGFFHWIKSPEGIGVCIIEVFILVVHLIYIGQPASANIIDEGYYVSDAVHFMYRLPMALPQHPPLGKWLIASGMYVFGDRPRTAGGLFLSFLVLSVFLFFISS